MAPACSAPPKPAGPLPVHILQVRALQPQAVAAWWQAGHPGWAIYPVDSEHFLTTGALDNVSLPLPNDSAIPTPGAGPAAAPAPPPPTAFMPPGGDAAAAAAAAVAGALGQHAGTPPLPPAAAPPSLAAAFNPALASAFMSAAGGAAGLPNDALLRAMSPLMHGGELAMLLCLAGGWGTRRAAVLRCPAWSRMSLPLAAASPTFPCASHLGPLQAASRAR